MSSGPALGSGQCSRVAEATPSSTWQPRHCAASKIGYTVRENEMGAADCCARTLREISEPRATAIVTTKNHGATPLLIDPGGWMIRATSISHEDRKARSPIGGSCLNDFVVIPHAP